jgi:hypothetical protein
MPQTLLNPFQRVFAMSLGIHSEVDCDSNDEFDSSIRPSPWTRYSKRSPKKKRMSQSLSALFIPNPFGATYPFVRKG